MSFTTTVKNELTNLDFSNTETIAELSGFVRSNYALSNNHLELSSENAKVAKRIYLLLKKTYGIDSVIEQKKIDNFSKKKIFIIMTVY